MPLKSTLARTLVRLFKARTSGMLFFLLALCLVVGIYNPAFWSFANVVNVLRGISFVVIVALGMTLVLISGGLDLSVGSTIGLGGVVTGMLLQQGMAVWVACLAGAALGGVVGMFNGVIITKARIPPLIVTLGSMYIARGAVLVMTRGRPVYPLPEGFNLMGTGSLFGIPYSVYVMVGLCLAAHGVLRRTVFGRCIYAIGGNEETARNAGIRVDRAKVVSYVVVGILAAITGILLSARMSSAVSNGGEGWELKVIASVIVGGTSMFGGIGSVGGTVVGASVMSILSTAMVMLNVSAYWQNIVVGGIIILAVGIDQNRRNRLA